MSYMSGMMMGLAFGKGLRRLFAGGAPGCAAKCAPQCAAPAFALAHAIPGRRRYYAKALEGNAELAQAVEKALAKLDFVDEVKANPVTGSLLLVYHGEEAAVDAVAERLASRVFGVPAQKTADAAPFQDDHSEGLAAFGQSLRATFIAINTHIKALTGGWFDLPSCLSLAFAVRGLQKILVTKQLPSGPQLIWWAFSLLRGWRIA